MQEKSQFSPGSLKFSASSDFDDPDEHSVPQAKKRVLENSQKLSTLDYKQTITLINKVRQLYNVLIDKLNKFGDDNHLPASFDVLDLSLSTNIINDLYQETNKKTESLIKKLEETIETLNRVTNDHFSPNVKIAHYNWGYLNIFISTIKFSLNLIH